MPAAERNERIQKKKNFIKDKERKIRDIDFLTGETFKRVMEKHIRESVRQH